MLLVWCEVIHNAGILYVLAGEPLTRVMQRQERIDMVVDNVDHMDHVDLDCFEWDWSYSLEVCSMDFAFLAYYSNRRRRLFVSFTQSPSQLNLRN